ncbi:MAG: CRTAC1 family protein, partial [Planctomycetaceae bacterium]|nr:CRTAC1 family protein [Planctomycetaceae bacterium]
ADFNGDGRLDIYVANDGMPNFLYVNRGESVAPRFENQSTLLGAAVNFQGKAEASMGVACGDYNGDGWMDLFLTHFYAETNTLYQNVDGASFRDETISAGLGPSSRSKLGFGTEFFDPDNDGRLDLIVTNGHIDDFSYKPGSPPYAMLPQLYRNQGGRFEDVSRWAGAFFQKPEIGRGLAVGDWDNDGDIDAAISHQKTASALVRNDTETEHRGIFVRLIGGPKSNRSAIHTIIEAEGEGVQVPLVREVIGGGSFQSHSDRRVHIGLGEAEPLERLKITWPSGKMDEWGNIKPGHYIAVEKQFLLPSPTGH